MLTATIEGQNKQLVELNQVRRAFETKHNTAHITAVLSNNRTLRTQHNRMLTARIEEENKHLGEVNELLTESREQTRGLQEQFEV
jgi:hypothetical protein